MSDIVFHKLIKNSFRNNIPSVQGTYPKWNLIRSRSGSIKIDDRDFKAFQQLYTVKPDGNVGNGEISLFWLYNYQVKNTEKPTNRAKSVGGKNADLNIDNMPVEAKAYKEKKTSPIKLGEFGGKKEFIKLVQLLFLIENLLNRKSENMIDLKNFSYKDLRIAAESMCKVRQYILQDTSGDIKKMPLFSNLYEKIEDIDKLFNSLGLKKCTFSKTASRPGGERIALDMSKYILTEMFKGKPGENGFMANMPPKEKNQFDSIDTVFIVVYSIKVLF